MNFLTKYLFQPYKQHSLFVQKKVRYLIFTDYVLILTFVLFALLNIYNTDYFASGLIFFSVCLFIFSLYLVRMEQYEMAANLTFLTPLLVISVDVFLAKNDPAASFQVSYRGAMSFLTILMITVLVSVKRYQAVLMTVVSLTVFFAYYFTRIYPAPELDHSLDLSNLVNILIHFAISGSTATLIIALTRELIELADEKTKNTEEYAARLEESMQDLKESTQKIIDSEKRQSAILNTIPDGILILNSEGVIQHKMKLEQLSLSFLYVDRGENIFSYMPSEKKEKLRRRHVSAFETNTLEIYRDGWKLTDKIEYLEFRFLKIDDQNILWLIRDLTKEHELEEKTHEYERNILAHQRMAMLGEMAYGIAHEINQPLNYIHGILQIMSIDLADGNLPREQLEEYLENSMHSSDRIVKIVNQLRSFAHKEHKEKEILEIKVIIENSQIIYRQRFHSRGIHFHYEISDPSLRILVDPVQIEQVFINLIQNSIDAFDDTDKEDKYIYIKAKKEEDILQIVYQDNGPGIPEEILQNVFSAFFTTKRRGRGTGLGLSIVKKIIDENEGSIRAESIQGQGTNFFITLPLNKEV